MIAGQDAVCLEYECVSYVLEQSSLNFTNYNSFSSHSEEVYCTGCLHLFSDFEPYIILEYFWSFFFFFFGHFNILLLGEGVFSYFVLSTR